MSRAPPPESAPNFLEVIDMPPAPYTSDEIDDEVDQHPSPRSLTRSPTAPSAPTPPPSPPTLASQDGSHWGGGNHGGGGSAARTSHHTALSARLVGVLQEDGGVDRLVRSLLERAHVDEQALWDALQESCARNP